MMEQDSLTFLFLPYLQIVGEAACLAASPFFWKKAVCLAADFVCSLQKNVTVIFSLPALIADKENSLFCISRLLLSHKG